MTESISTFRVDSLYSHEQIYRSLSVSNSGGIRIRLSNDGSVRRAVVLTSSPSSRRQAENPYHDRIEGNTLVYTAAGREGHQTLAGVNAWLVSQPQGKFPIYGFTLTGSRRDKRLGSNRWRFLGLLEFLRHYQELQSDARGESRLAWVFEFLVHDDPLDVPLAIDAAICGDQLAASKFIVDDTTEDRQVDFPTTGRGDGGIASIQKISAIRSKLLATEPGQFERLIRDLLLSYGFERVEVTRYSQDGGVDVNAYAGKAMWPVRDLLVQVQAKRWLHTVGRREVAELRGSLQPFARGTVITTSHFSKAAISEASSPGKLPIILIDGLELGSILEEISGGAVDQFIEQAGIAP